MALDGNDRPRLMIAAFLTIVALPLLWITTRSDDSAGDSNQAEAASAENLSINGIPLDAAPVSGAGEPGPTTTSNRSNLPALEPIEDSPVFMDGPAAEPVDTPNQIAVAERPEVAPLQLSATYRSTIAGFRSCLVAGFPSGRTVTVRNLDNGREVTCVTSIAPADQIDDVVLHTRSFEELADLTEAPIPVEITL